jgi:hypothetical protein
MSFQHVIFFDNSQDRIDEVSSMCPTIRCVKIPEKMVATPPDMLWTDPIIRPFLIAIGDNNKYLKALREREELAGDRYDEVSGIHPPDILELGEWMDSIPAGESAAVIFDWDRTITVIEGLFGFNKIKRFEEHYQPSSGMSVEEFQRIFREDTITYLLGGLERIAYIREMLNIIHANGIAIFILTNNGSCGADTFYPYIQALTPHIPLENMLCSKVHPHNGNKGTFLQAHPKFRHLCPQPVANINGNTRSRKRRGRRVTVKRRSNSRRFRKKE